MISLGGDLSQWPLKVRVNAVYKQNLFEWLVKGNEPAFHIPYGLSKAPEGFVKGCLRPLGDMWDLGESSEIPFKVILVEWGLGHEQIMCLKLDCNSHAVMCSPLSQMSAPDSRPGM